jgi:hypothetical protein
MRSRTLSADTNGIRRRPGRRTVGPKHEAFSTQSHDNVTPMPRLGVDQNAGCAFPRAYDHPPLLGAGTGSRMREDHDQRSQAYVVPSVV